MDNIMFWASQISHVSRRICATMGSLKKWKKILPIRTKILLITSLLLPITDYADICYLDSSQEHLDRLECLQNICIRYMYIWVEKI